MSAPTFIFQNSDMSRNQANNVWGGLKRGIEEIQNGNAGTLRFEELYRNAYTLVLHKHGELLYKGVDDVIRAKLFRIARNVIETSESFLIPEIVARWERHTLTMTMVRDILMYMDKTYCDIKKKMNSYDLGVRRFKEIVLTDENVLERLISQILSEIKRQRDGEKIDDSLMRNVLRMFVDVDQMSGTHKGNDIQSANPNQDANIRSQTQNGQSYRLYEIAFEKRFIDETKSFYTIESEIFIAENTVPDYLFKAEGRLIEEENRADSYIPIKHTRELLKVTVEAELIGRYRTQLIEHETGCKDMFAKSKIPDLNRMYRLLSRIDAKITSLQDAMYEYIINEGTRIVSDQENLKNPEKFVTEVLDLRTQFQAILEKAFGDDKNFAMKMNGAFTEFINTDMRAAQYLSLYTDGLLKKHASKLTEKEVDDSLDKVITIFKYLQDKDIFEDFYKQHLAARLLLTKSQSDHYERSMISKLKTECGHQYTAKLEGMFKDITISQGVNDEYRGHVEKMRHSDPSLVELDTKVLTTGFWPFPAPKKNCRLPDAVQTECEKFRRFYCDKHSGRKLVFDTSHGRASLQVEFDGGRKELVCTTYQMCILMLYNICDVCSWKDIKEKLEIDGCDLEPHILGLAHPKVKILLKKPNRKELHDDDKFAFNKKYKNQRYRVQLSMLQSNKLAKNTKAQVPQHVQEARKNRVEAAIVRIMKARKTLDHNNLVSEVVRQLTQRFSPEPTFIKQRIASLIEREYLRRDEDDRRKYHYVA